MSCVNPRKASSAEVHFHSADSWNHFAELSMKFNVEDINLIIIRKLGTTEISLVP